MRLINADEIRYVMGSTDTSELDYVRRYAIDRIPTVDAVPVVRCRNCAFSEESKSEIENRWCHKHVEYVPNDYYCAGGKR